MIKKFILAILLLVLLGLSLALYNQYTMLPERTVSELNATQRESDVIQGTWAPPEQPQAPQEPQTRELAAWQEGGSPEVPDSAAADADAPSQKTTATDSSAAADSKPDSSQPADSQPDSSKQDESDADKQLGRPELTEGMQSPKKHDVDAEHPEERSKAEKALSRGAGWMLDQGRQADQAIESVERELDREQGVINDLELSSKDETSPKAEVNKLVQKLEKKSLKQDEDQNADQSADQASTPAPPSAEATQQAARKPAEKPQQPETAQPSPQTAAGVNNKLMAMDLLSDGQAVLLRLNTRAPVQDYKDFMIKAPKRFVIDLYGHFDRSVPRLQVLPNAMVEDLRTGLHRDKLRIVADLHDDVQATVSVERRSDTELVVVMRPAR